MKVSVHNSADFVNMPTWVRRKRDPWFPSLRFRLVLDTEAFCVRFESRGIRSSLMRKAFSSFGASSAHFVDSSPSQSSWSHGISCFSFLVVLVLQILAMSQQVSMARICQFLLLCSSSIAASTEPGRQEGPVRMPVFYTSPHFICFSFQSPVLWHQVHHWMQKKQMN